MIHATEAGYKRVLGKSGPLKTLKGFILSQEIYIDTQ